MTQTSSFLRRPNLSVVACHERFVDVSLGKFVRRWVLSTPRFVRAPQETPSTGWTCLASSAASESKLPGVNVFVLRSILFTSHLVARFAVPRGKFRIFSRCFRECPSMNGRRIFLQLASRASGVANHFRKTAPRFEILRTRKMVRTKIPRIRRMREATGARRRNSAPTPSLQPAPAS